jgi:hypothetical protein
MMPSSTFVTADCCCGFIRFVERSSGGGDVVVAMPGWLTVFATRPAVFLGRSSSIRSPKNHTKSPKERNDSLFLVRSKREFLRGLSLTTEFFQSPGDGTQSVNQFFLAGHGPTLDKNHDFAAAQEWWSTTVAIPDRSKYISSFFHWSLLPFVSILFFLLPPSQYKPMLRIGEKAERRRRGERR